MPSIIHLPAFDKLKTDTFCPEFREYVAMHLGSCARCQTSIREAVDVIFAQLPILKVVGLDKKTLTKTINDTLTSLSKEQTNGRPKS